jgi:hypothetical protein
VAPRSRQAALDGLRVQQTRRRGRGHDRPPPSRRSSPSHSISSRW